MINKFIIILLFILIVVGGISYLNSTGIFKKSSPGVVACTMEAKICPDGSAVGRTGPNCEFALCPQSKTDFSWKFTEVESKNEIDPPQTTVGLKYNGTYEGGCFEIDGERWKLLFEEKYGAICYFAGGGTEIGVFEEEGNLVVKKGVLDEGDAETPGVRGNFELLFRLEK